MTAQHETRTARTLDVIRALTGRQPQRRPPPPQKSVLDELEALRSVWGGLYWFRGGGDGYEATRRQRPHITLTAPTPSELRQQLAADSGAW